jgi:hypothetical protein
LGQDGVFGCSESVVDGHSYVHFVCLAARAGEDRAAEQPSEASAANFPLRGPQRGRVRALRARARIIDLDRC